MNARRRPQQVYIIAMRENSGKVYLDLNKLDGTSITKRIGSPQIPFAQGFFNATWSYKKNSNLSLAYGNFPLTPKGWEVVRQSGHPEIRSVPYNKTKFIASLPSRY